MSVLAEAEQSARGGNRSMTAVCESPTDATVSKRTDSRHGQLETREVQYQHKEGEAEVRIIERTEQSPGQYSHEYRRKTKLFDFGGTIRFGVGAH